LTRGKILPNPSGLLKGERFSKFIEELSKEHDLVIFDIPPVLAVTDASIIRHHAGTSFMLVGFEQSSIKEIAAAANRFELNGII
jgi:tyrosine-protein kinase Etk/Wzc